MKSTMITCLLMAFLSVVGTAAAATIQLPKTGQTSCYDTTGATISCSGTGQDGELLKGTAWPNRRFSDNGDQTMTDNLTGLVWTKDGSPMLARDRSFDTDAPAGDSAVTWQLALDYLKKLNAENYLGHNDWRLPNRSELESLVNKGEKNPANWLGTQGFTNSFASYYWTSTTSAGFAPYSWYVKMSQGVVSGDYKNKSYNLVWPVRSGTASLPKTGQTACFDDSGAAVTCSGTGQDGELQQGAAWPAPRFTANADQTVTDNLTGLLWSKDANPASVPTTWQQALDGIKSLNSSNYLGHNDWRLPNRNELESLYNKGVDNSVTWLLDQSFSNVQTTSYWTGTSFSHDPSYAWYVKISTGDVIPTPKSLGSYYWPVRDGQPGTSVPVALSVARSGTGSGTVTSTTGGINCGSTCSASFSSGSSVTLTAAPASGSTFAGWSGACSGTAGCTVTMDVAKSVTASFSLVSASGNVACGDASGQSFSVQPSDNLLCKNGTVNGLNSNSISWQWNCVSGTAFVSCSAEKTTSQDTTSPTVTAFTLPATSSSLTVSITSFTATDNVSVSSYCLIEATSANGCNWNSTKPTSYTFSAAGTKTLYAYARDAAGNISPGKSAPVTITLPAAAGICSNANGQSFPVAPTNLCNSGTPVPSILTGSGPWKWSCNGSSAASCSANILSTVTYRVSFISGDNNTGTIAGTTDQTVNSGGSTTPVTAVPATGYHFVNWTEGVTVVETKADLTIDNVTAKRDITANFTANDTKTPDLTLSTLADKATTANAILNVAGSASDNDSGVQSVTVNNRLATLISKKINNTVFSEFSVAVALVTGPNTITTVATDNANNSRTDERTITLDRIAPLLNITVPADNSVSNKTLATVIGSVDDSNTVVTVKVGDGSPTTAKMKGKDFAAEISLVDGLNTIYVTATNSVGSSYAKRTVTYDYKVPTLAITKPLADTGTTDNSTTIRGTVKDVAGNVTIHIAVDDGTIYDKTISGETDFEQIVTLPADKPSAAVVVTVTDESNNKATVQRNIIKFPKAKVYLGGDDSFTIGNSGVTLYGGSGNDTVTITYGMSGVVLDQNVERINLPVVSTDTPPKPLISSDYTFKQTGNKINIYDTAGTKLLVTAPVQGDSDGTILSFSDGTVSAKLNSGVMTLGGEKVSSDTAKALTLQTTPDTQSAALITNSKVYLGMDDNFTVNNIGTKLYGSIGIDVVTIAAGMSGVVLDQNVEQINLPGPLSSYAFKQTGNKINVYYSVTVNDASTGLLVVSAPVQGGSIGTVLSFSDGNASALLTGGVMTLGGATVSSTTAGVLSPVLK